MSEHAPAIPSTATAALLLADGTVFFGKSIGANTLSSGEICFNTGMTGYQETLTDPSFAGQIITFTFPHIGNIGCNAEDAEALKPYCAGLVVRELPTLPSNYRSEDSLENWLKRHRLPGIAGVDTRAITRHIRLKGAQNAVIFPFKGNFDAAKKAAVEKLKSTPDMEGLDLAKTVTSTKTYEWSEGTWTFDADKRKKNANKYHVVAMDFGEKLNILRCLADVGCKVTVVPAKTSAEDILKLKPNGIFLSNGPGDPAATGIYAVPTLQKLIASGTPIFGICLGHQLLGLALGGKTEKLKQGHRGANQPVKNLETGAVEITSQNHGFAVVEKTLPKNVKITHVSLFDGTVEGLRCTDKPVFAVQYHPEASPGPHDSQYLFRNFVKLMEAKTHAS